MKRRWKWKIDHLDTTKLDLGLDIYRNIVNLKNALSMYQALILFQINYFCICLVCW